MREHVGSDTTIVSLRINRVHPEIFEGWANNDGIGEPERDSGGLKSVAVEAVSAWIDGIQCIVRQEWSSERRDVFCRVRLTIETARTVALYPKRNG